MKWFKGIPPILLIVGYRWEIVGYHWEIHVIKRFQVINLSFFLPPNGLFNKSRNGPNVIFFSSSFLFFYLVWNDIQFCLFLNKNGDIVPSDIVPSLKDNFDFLEV